MNSRKLKFLIILFLMGLILGTYVCRFVLMNLVVHTNDGGVMSFFNWVLAVFLVGFAHSLE